MTRDEIAAFFARRAAAYGRKDIPAIAADYAADCVVDSPSGGTHEGRDAAEQVIRSVVDALEVRMHEQALIIDGDRVVQEVIIEGTDVGPFLGLPPTGRSFRVPGVFVYELKDGLIARERRIYDLSALLIQVGLLKVKPG